MKLRDRSATTRGAPSPDNGPAPLLAGSPGAEAPSRTPDKITGGVTAAATGTASSEATGPATGPATGRATPPSPPLPAASPGRTQLPDPALRLATPARWAEPIVAGVLAVGAGLAAWALAAPAAAVVPVLALPAVCVLALIAPRERRARLWRGLAMLAAAGAVGVTTPQLVPVTLVIVLATAATYPALLGRAAAVALTFAGVCALAAPLASQFASDRPAWSGDIAGSAAQFLAGSLDPAVTAARLGLAGGMAVVLVLGWSGAINRRALTVTASLAERRGRDVRRAAAALNRVASHDPVTELPNREALVREVALALTRADRNCGRSTLTSDQTGLMVLHLDRFAVLADSLGPAASDDVLRQVARRMRASRPAGDVAARLGREEFALLLGTGTDEQACAAAARRMIALLEEPITMGDQEVCLTCSVGIAVSGSGVDTAEVLVHAAEEAARAAQHGGRPRLVTSDRALREGIARRARLELELREAVRQDRIRVHYQPVLALGLDADADRIVAVEAQPSWTRADGSIVDAERFLPLADELGIGVTLGLQVIDQALDRLTSWRHTGYAVDQVWVTLVPGQLTDPEFPHMLSARLAADGIPASSLMVQVGAACFVESEQAESTLGMLRSLGVAIAIDDFGRAGTSLTALRHLPVTVAKLDRELVCDLGRPDVAHRSVARATADLCRTLGLRVVADGVESREQLEGARAMGVEAVQGPGIAPLVPAAEAVTYLPDTGSSGVLAAPAGVLIGSDAGSGPAQDNILS